MAPSDIFIGVNALDYSGYPDCRPEFIRAFEQLARLATKAGVEGRPLTMHTPLIQLSKADIIRLGLSLGLDYGLTHSCYDPRPDGGPCGHCDSCRLRAAGFAEAGATDPLIRPAALIRFARSLDRLAQPLRRQISFVVSILTVLVFAAIGYGARLTYDEHVRQLAAETGTMAATVVVYVNRNLETADAVAATASRHPSMRALDPHAATEVLLPLLTGSDQLLNNALIADGDGQPVAWAAPPDPAVEGRLDRAWLTRSRTTGKTPDQPDARQGGRFAAHAIVLGYPIVSPDGTCGRRARTVGASRGARDGAGVDSAAAGLGGDADRRQQRGRGAQPRGRAVRRPLGGAGRHAAQSIRSAGLGDPDRR